MFDELCQGRMISISLNAGIIMTMVVRRMKKNAGVDGEKRFFSGECVPDGQVYSEPPL